jgi:hypothetical protein
MKPTDCVRPIVAGIDGSTAAINAAHRPIDEAISRAIPMRLSLLLTNGSRCRDFSPYRRGLLNGRIPVGDQQISPHGCR